MPIYLLLPTLLYILQVSTIADQYSLIESNQYNYCIAEILAREDSGKFGKLMANRQNFLPQIYEIFGIHVLFVDHSLYSSK